MSAITFEGLTAARSMLQTLVDGLRDAAGGGVVERAAEKVGAQVTAVSTRTLGKHVYTGAAQGGAAITVAGGRVDLASPGYLRYHSWWPFRRGMPGFVVRRASIIFARELLSALDGKAGAASDAAHDIVDADDAARAAASEKKAKSVAAKAKRADALAKFKADVKVANEKGREAARAYRASPQGKAERAAKRAERRRASK